MKRTGAILLALLLAALPLLACAEEFTLSADALNAAQSISALRERYTSLLVLETDESDGAIETRWLWDGTDAEGRAVQAVSQSDGHVVMLVNGVFYDYDAATGDIVCCAWLPGAYEAFQADWEAQLQLFDEDMTFTAAEDGTAAYQMATTTKDDSLNETWVINASDYALQSYACVVQGADDTYGRYDLSVIYGAPSLVADDVLAELGGETFTLTLVSADGSETTQKLPKQGTIAFTDGAEQVLVFRDAAYTQPVSSLDPAEEDVSNGLTLYVSEE